MPHSHVPVAMPTIAARGAQVLAVYPSRVSRLCSRDEGVHPPLSVAITPERAPLPLAEVEEGDDEVEGEL